MSQRWLSVVGVLIAAVILVPGLVHAGGVQLGGQGGTEDPPGELCDEDSDEGCTVQVDWNPSRHCVADPPGDSGEAGVYTDLDSLLGCMLNEEERQSGHFHSWPLDGAQWGIGIHRLLPFTVPDGLPQPDPVEIERLEIFENDPGIGTIQVFVDRSGLVARIQKITEGPDPIGTGSITIELDDDIVELEEKEDLPPDDVKWTETWNTTGLTGLDLNVAIFVWLRVECGFQVHQDAGYFVVSRDGGFGFRRVQFRSAVESVISSDLALLPKSDPDVVHLFDIGL
jgi:hypothetical protein